MTDIRGERRACPLYTAIGVIAGRWKPMLFQRLSQHPMGFGALRRSLPGVSSKVLTEQLRQLEDDAIIQRIEIGDELGSVRYAVTDYGRTLAPVFATLWTWGQLHLKRSAAVAGTRVSAPRSRTETGD